ncbi:solute carrier family 25 member 44-like, partial [Trifolium medium]|nr:solute carrier family 25 member 44-like [Trifolium medium]
MVWGGVGCYLTNKKGGEGSDNNNGGNVLRPDTKTVMAVQGISAAMAGG